MKKLFEYIDNYIEENVGAGGDAGGGEAAFGLDSPPGGVKTSDIATFTPPMNMKKKRKKPSLEEELE